MARFTTGAGMSAGKRPAWGALLFHRVIDIPFATCVTAVESGQLTGLHGGLHAGQSLVCGPAGHDRDCGTCQIQVRLARGPLHRRLPMRLEFSHWSSTPPRTAVELIPCGQVRPSAAYFRAGHFLLDRLTGALAQHCPAQRPGYHPAPASPAPDPTLPGHRTRRINGPATATTPPGPAAQHQPTRPHEHEMTRFIDFHDDLKLPAQAIARIAKAARTARADRFGVRQIELYHNPQGKVYCLLEGPDEDAIRHHHAALGMPCGNVHQVDSLT